MKTLTTPAQDDPAAPTTSVRRRSASAQSRAPKKAAGPVRARGGSKATKKRKADAGPRRGRSVVYPHAAGVDLGASAHYVAGPSTGQAAPPVRCFGSDTASLRELAQWLKDQGADTVAMEATGVYWQPLYFILEAAGLHPVLTDAYQCKNVPGRKTDLKDCQWLQQLHRWGLLRAAFVPEASVRELRALDRHRQNLIEAKSCHLLHIQKALDEMNLRLHGVLSDLSGQSGQRILDAILRGERDPQVLAALIDERVQATPAQVAAALVGEYRTEQLLIVRQELESFRALEKQIAEVEAAAEAALAQWPSAPALAGPTPPSEPGPTKRPRHRTPRERSLAAQMQRIIGFDLTCIPGISIITLFTILSEIGLDLSPWRHAKAFSSWLGLCPNHRISGGRVLSARTRKVRNRLANLLRMAAMAAGKTDTPLGAFYRRKRAQFGAPKANTATARKLACLLYHCLSRREPYRPQTAGPYEERLKTIQLARARQRVAELEQDLATLKAA